MKGDKWTESCGSACPCARCDRMRTALASLMESARVLLAETKAKVEGRNWSLN